MRLSRGPFRMKQQLRDVGEPRPVIHLEMPKLSLQDQRKMCFRTRRYDTRYDRQQVHRYLSCFTSAMRTMSVADHPRDKSRIGKLE